jgi:hypothetical protein
VVRERSDTVPATDTGSERPLTEEGDPEGRSCS